MNFYLVLWHQTDGRLNGWDLVYAKDKRAARRRYQEEHYSPVDTVVSQANERLRALREDLNPETDTLFSGINTRDYELARAGRVVTIEEGT